MTTPPAPSRRRPLVVAWIAALALSITVPAIATSAGSTDHGLLSVSTSPTVPGLVSVNGVPRNSGSIDGLELAAGTHEVCFSAVPGFLTPGCETVTVTEASSTTLSAAYVPAGTLEVAASPEDLRPLVTVDGLERDRAPVSVDLEPGEHEVCFEDVGGYESVDCQVVESDEGAATSVETSYRAIDDDPGEPDPGADPGPDPSESITTSMEDSIEQHGLEVAFDREYPVGRFVSGDHFVVGSPTVVSTAPQWDGRRHGALVNPTGGYHHGYHADAPGYSADLNVAADLPHQLRPGDSYIQTYGWVPGEPGTESIHLNNRWDALRPSVRDAMVVTVLDEAPPEGSFRPPYTGSSKPLHNVADLRTDLLPRLAAPDTAPSWTDVEGSVDRVWLDHKAHDTGRYIQPHRNMSTYGRDIAHDINRATYMLMLDYPIEQKHTTLYQVVQIGIDSYANALQATREDYLGDSGHWSGGWGGALGVGRKWPVLFSGIMLDDHGGMRDVGASLDPSFWQEDAQTYYVPSTNDGLDHLRSPGEASWGERAYTHPSDHGIPGNTSYRTQGARSWNAAALGARMMNAEDLWNWDAFFDYTDYHMRTESGAHRAQSQFFADMWDTYRDRY